MTEVPASRHRARVAPMREAAHTSVVSYCQPPKTVDIVCRNGLGERVFDHPLTVSSPSGIQTSPSAQPLCCAQSWRVLSRSANLSWPVHSCYITADIQRWSFP